MKNERNDFTSVLDEGNGNKDNKLALTAGIITSPPKRTNYLNQANDSYNVESLLSSSSTYDYNNTITNSSVTKNSAKEETLFMNTPLVVSNTNKSKSILGEMKIHSPLPRRVNPYKNSSTEIGTSIVHKDLNFIKHDKPKSIYHSEKISTKTKREKRKN